MGIKGKIVSAISFICLTICLFMVGVWALTETDFSVSGDIEYTAPVTADDVGTYSTLKFFVNDDGENTVSVMANQTNKPTGELVIPAHVSSGGTVYTVTRIEYSTAETLSTQEVSVTPHAVPSGPSRPPEEEVLGAFAGCSGLTSVTIPDSIRTIGDLAFNSCRLTEVNYLGDINDWVQIEFASSFSNPTKISGSLKINGEEVTNAVINTATTIKDCVFQDLTKLTSVTIGNQVTSISGTAFMNCSGLTEVNYLGDINSWVQIEFNGNPIGSSKSLKINGVEVTSAVIDTATTINAYAFKGRTKLTSVTLGNQVISIGEEAFMGCASLASINIPNGVETIGEYAFRDCSSIKNITIPNSVTSMSKAFDGSGIESATIESGATKICASAFRGCTSLISVTIPDSVTIIDSYAFTTCTKLTSVTIPDSVISIGEYAFYFCKSLASVTIGNGVTSIGNYAFSDCSGLTSINIPNGVETIGEYAFRDCSSIKNITIPNSVTSMSKAFDGSGIESATIESGATKICASAFRGCTSLISVTIPDSVTNIYSYAFSNCTSLASINIPVGVKAIGYNAFEGCTSLTSITIPDGVMNIYNYTFSGCRGLTKVIIGSSVTSIGLSAFDYCSNLADVYYRGNETQWNAISIGSNNDPLNNATKHYGYTGA